MLHGLTPNDLAEYAALKKVVQVDHAIAIKHAERTGSALIEIRDRRLYRAEFKSFEEFCEKVLGRSRAYTDRLISFEKAKIENRTTAKTEGEHRSEPTGPNGPKNDAIGVTSDNITQSRTISKLDHRAKNASLQPEAPKREDKTGYIIPDQWVPLFDRTSEVNELRRKVSEVRVALEKAQENNDLLFFPISHSIVISELDAAYKGLESAIPFAVCPYCQGQTADHCRACKGRGVVSKHFYYEVADKALVEIREKAIALRKGQPDE